ncbi:bacterial Fe(2+) trafficking family protein [Vibrio parahaemolyticus VPCR-2010]|uniref:Fe(2+)-trafficking protein n=1 Tax=Vibrio parahaemolyticus TaxID=670 RepID=UPI00038E64B1|nr:bacterial Fe(2+) trafficking family protein [Vibrio parahaemolyticus VPCR-2010]
MKTVLCVKYGKELEALPKPPIKGELGEKVYQKLSAKGWRLWLMCQTIIINDQGLNLMEDGVIDEVMESLSIFLENNEIEQELLNKLVKQDVELPDDLLSIAKQRGLLSESEDNKEEPEDMFYEA